MTSEQNTKPRGSVNACRVLIIIENTSFTYDTRIQNVARSLEMAGHEVLVISPRFPVDSGSSKVGNIESWHYPMPHIPDGIAGHLLEYFYSTFMIGLYSLASFIIRRPKIVHFCSPPDVLFPLAWLFRLFRKRLIVDVHDLSPELAQVRYNLPENHLLVRSTLAMEKMMLRSAHRLIATNDSQKEVLADRVKVVPDRIAVVRNGVNLDSIPDKEADRPSAVPTVGYLGTMNPQDGIDLLLEAAAHVRDELNRPEIRFVLIGDGGAEDSLKALSASLGLDEVVTFTGRLKNREALERLTACDICVQPDPKNIFTDTCTMVKGMEYMALGKPIVAFRLIETERSLGEAAVYAKENSPTDLAEKIVEVIDNPDLRQRMSAVGRARFEERFVWTRSEPVLLETYRLVT